jgi:phosphoenolpyruvate-protein phosphotransferase (PTS system enzyme I)
MKSTNDFFHGKGVVRGIAIGRAYVHSHTNEELVLKHIDKESVDYEILRFESSLEKSWNQLEKIKEKLGKDHTDPGHIIEAQQMMLRDDELKNSVTNAISNDLVNVEWAINKAIKKWEKIFDGVEDEYIKERYYDIKHLFNRFVRNLSGTKYSCLNPPPDAIVIAKEISPAETIQLGRNAISAIVTEKGGKTSHTVIIAKAFEIPTIVGVKSITETVGNGDLIIVDGAEGILIINPDIQHIQEYRQRMYKDFAREQNLISQSSSKAVTLDNHELNIFANIDFVDEIENAHSHGAEGIGLYRTEFLFLSNFSILNDEEIHFNDTMKLMESWGSGTVTIRTFDLGSDKFVYEEQIEKESNPALGLRSIRLALTMRPLLKKQLRGILRASVFNKDINLRIMFPLISSYDEFIEAKDVYFEAANELVLEGHELPDNIKVGSMIELPSACIISDILAQECDFFSIGSNDLIQYSVAVDRNNDLVSHLFTPLHPGVLRMINKVIENGKNANIPVSLCGDMATDPISALILIGMGLLDFSIPPGFIPHIKRLIKSVEYKKLKKFTELALKMRSHNEIEQLFRKNFGNLLIEELPYEGDTT